MPWRIHETDDTVVLALEDEAASGIPPTPGAGELAEFRNLAATKPAGGVVDLGGLRHMSSNTLAWLLCLVGHGERHAFTLRVSNVAPELREVLRRVGLDVRLDGDDDERPGDAGAGVPRPHPPGGLGGSAER